MLDISVRRLLEAIAAEDDQSIWETDGEELVDWAVARAAEKAGYISIGGAGQNVSTIYRLTNRGRLALGLEPKIGLFSKIAYWVIAKVRPL